jgi:hypothetical protein
MFQFFARTIIKYLQKRRKIIPFSQESVDFCPNGIYYMYGDYTSGWPVMAAGCSMPISLRMVGATSASFPFFTSDTASPALITMKGTSLSE